MIRTIYVFSHKSALLNITAQTKSTLIQAINIQHTVRNVYSMVKAILHPKEHIIKECNKYISKDMLPNHRHTLFVNIACDLGSKVNPTTKRNALTQSILPKDKNVKPQNTTKHNRPIYENLTFS